MKKTYLYISILLFSVIFLATSVDGKNIAGVEINTYNLSYDETLGKNELENNLDNGKIDTLQESCYLQVTDLVKITENRGQIGISDFTYYIDLHPGIIGFDQSKVYYSVKDHLSQEITQYSIVFLDSNKVTPQPRELCGYKTNYYVGEVQITNIRSWQEIYYPEIYDGIDLRYYISKSGVKYEFIVEPLADPSQIRIAVDSDLSLEVAKNTVNIIDNNYLAKNVGYDKDLKSFQNEKLIESKFVEYTKNTYGFQIGEYDSSLQLTIDPLVLEFSTYFGGNGSDTLQDIVIDEDGNKTISGMSRSTDFLAINGTDPPTAWADAFIAKLTPTDEIEYLTFYGGWGYDVAHALALDESMSPGNVLAVGYTDSGNLVMVNEIDYTLNGTSDAFIIKLNASGHLKFSTYFGGSGKDYATSITSHSEMVTIMGYTESDDIPLPENAYDDSYGGNGDLFIYELWDSGSDTYDVYSGTYLGGSGQDTDGKLVYDHLTQIHIFTARTNSEDFATFTGDYNGGAYDVVVGLMSESWLQYATYFGGSGSDIAQAITVDSRGTCFVAGKTYSEDLPINGGYQTSNSGDSDGFIAKFRTSDLMLQASTYFGGSEVDYFMDIAFSTDGEHIIAVGETASSDLLVHNAYDDSYNGAGSMISQHSDIMVVSFSRNLENLFFCTYIGGLWQDMVRGLAIDSDDGIYVVGYTWTDDFPLVNEFYDVNEFEDGIIFKFTFEAMIEDTVKPTISVDLENNAYILPETNITLTISDDSSGIQSKLFAWNEETSQEFSGYRLAAPIINGMHNLHLTAIDVAGNIKEKSYNFYVDGSAPNITFTGLQGGMTVGNALVFGVDISDESALEETNFIVEGVTIETTQLNSYMFELNTWKYPNGELAITIESTDVLGNSEVINMQITVEHKLIGLDYGSFFITLGSILVPVLGLTFVRSFNFRHRRIISKYLDSELSLEEIAKQKGTSVRRIERILKKAGIL